MIIKNFFENIPASLPEEFVEDILTTKNFRIEKIISDGHASPENFWYDQDENEFVMLLSGSAILSFENEPDIKLNPGDYLIIPAHKKHCVKETDSTHKTFWLTLFY